MKNLLLIPFILCCFFVNAQIESRELIKGKINVAADGDAEGINVYNSSTTEGTSTNRYGEFIIAVKEKDKLIFTGIQYQEFTVIIDESVIENKELNITIREAITELQEVIVKPYNLSGDVSVDVKKIRTTDTNVIDTNSLAIVETYEYEFRPDKYTSPENAAINKGYLTNGLNFANMFRTIFNSKDKSGEHKDVDVEIRKVYNDEFFKHYLDIKRENINDFIFYAEKNGLEEEMLERGSELKLIEFLIHKSSEFKAQQE